MSPSARGWRRREPIWRSLAAGVAVSLGLLALSRTGLVGVFELDAFDRLLAFRADVERAAEAARDPGVVLVTISENDLQAYGHPLSDQTLADAIERLRELGARGIGVDVYRDMPVPPGHERLAAITRRDPHLVFVEKLSDTDDQSVRSPAFASADRIGVGDLLPDLDGIVRRALLFAWDADGHAHLALGLRVALLTLASDTPPRTTEPAADGEPKRQPLRLGVGRLERWMGDDGPYSGADDSDYQILFDQRRASIPLPSVALAALLRGEVSRTEIEGRAALIGVVAASVRDDFRAPPPTPFATARVVRGVELHGALVEQLLRIARRGDPPIRLPDPACEALLVLLSGLAGAFAARRLPGGAGLAVTGFGGACLLSLIGSGVMRAGIALPLGLMVLAFVVAAAIAQSALRLYEHRRRDAIERLLVPHISRGVRAVLASQETRLLRGEGLEPSHATATILFADVDGWGDVVRNLPANAALEWLGEVLGAVATAIEQEGGTVEDFAGDGIKACFGVWTATDRSDAGPPPTDAGTGAALAASLRIARALDALSAACALRSLPAPRLRIGIHTGELVIGSVGTRTRLKLATVGSTVNVAARLEALARVDQVGQAGETEAMTACDRTHAPEVAACAQSSCCILLSDAVLQRFALTPNGAASPIRVIAAGEHSVPDVVGRVKAWRLVAGVLLALASLPLEALHANAEDAVRPADAAASAAATTGTTEATARDAAGDGATRPAQERETAGQPHAVPTPYVPPPPPQRVTWRRVGGATRAAAHCDTQLTAFAPAEHVGLTVRAAPTLVFALARATECPVELVLNDPRALEPLVETRIPGPLAAGVHRVALKNHGISLEPNLTYTWFVQVIADPARRSSDLVAGGGVRRIVDAAAPAPPDDDAALLARGLEFAHASLWYDAVADLAAAAERDVATARDSLGAVLAAEGLEIPAR